MNLYGICREEGRCICGLCEAAGKKPTRGYLGSITKQATLPAPRARVTCISCGGQNGGHFHWCLLAAHAPEIEPAKVTRSLEPPYCGWCGSLRHQGRCKSAIIAS